MGEEDIDLQRVITYKEDGGHMQNCTLRWWLFSSHPCYFDDLYINGIQ